MSGKLLEIDQVAGLFGAGLDGCGWQAQLMLEGGGDAVQLPDELFEIFRAANLQVAVPQKADGEHKENGQADGQRGEYDALEDRVERRQGWVHWGPPGAGYSGKDSAWRGW